MHKWRHTDRYGVEREVYREKIPLPGGKSKYLTAPTRAALRAKIKAWEEEQQELEEQRDGREPLSRYFPRWLDQVRLQLRPTTWATYERDWRNHIRPALGPLAVREIKPSDVNVLLAAMRKKGLAEATIEHARSVLRRGLRPLVADGVLLQNPVAASTPPRVRATPPVTWTAEQLRHFLQHPAVTGHRWFASFYLAGMRGMRMGEILGLQDSRIDWDREQLLVDASLQLVKHQPVLMKPKTEDSRRTVPLTPGALAALRHRLGARAKEQLAAGPEWEEHGLLFTTRIGRPVRPDVWRAVFHRLVQKAGLPRIKPHAMRHTCATLLLESGVSPRIVQELLGHATISITLGIYSHVSEDITRETAAEYEKKILG